LCSQNVPWKRYQVGGGLLVGFEDNYLALWKNHFLDQFLADHVVYHFVGEKHMQGTVLQQVHGSQVVP